MKKALIAPVLRALVALAAHYGLRLDEETLMAAYVAIEAVAVPIGAALVAKRAAAQIAPATVHISEIHSREP